MQIMRQSVQQQGRYWVNPLLMNAMDRVCEANEDLAFLLLHDTVWMNKQAKQDIWCHLFYCLKGIVYG